MPCLFNERFWSTLTVLLICSQAFGKLDKSDDIAWNETFDKTQKEDGRLVPEGWKLETKLGVPAAKFSVVKDGKSNFLLITADKATGTFLKPIDDIDLNEYPILTWKWRVLELPKGADGRDPDKDDQAVSVYLGTGTFFRNAISYRWDTETPVGAQGECKYGAGLIKVKWFCLRDKKSGLDKWYVEKRNVAEDFKKTYGYVPSDFAISIVSNSQYTGTQAKAEIQWIRLEKPEIKPLRQ